MERFLGKWLFRERFDCGYDAGFAFFALEDGKLVGVLEYKEVISGDEPFKVRQYVECEVVDCAICMKGVLVTDLDGNLMDDYNPDILEGFFTAEGKIVGHSFDSEAVCGFFEMQRGN
ncbi:MAG: hypothetical protein J6Q03_10110 [Paludibacteraceae bacterium]|jgi:hypothetical protein|nr:hypothetical protein [Paludibacteraceae bacterium]MBO5989807.1 hypothetical protein [Paludibacteraceae bacterium]MEE0996936.1 hypothetical protein [Paludibacteraceae bacterium]MEE1542970.1 hypothetical protein [Paludibacteraceae bacterium]